LHPHSTASIPTLRIPSWSQEYLHKLKQFEDQQPPPTLVAAAAAGPIPLVWAFRRARRARPLPPAYVLMYHCERQVQLDHSYLATSLQQHYNRAPKAQESARAEVPSEDELELQDVDPEVLQGLRGLQALQKREVPRAFDKPKSKRFAASEDARTTRAAPVPVLARPAPPPAHPMRVPSIAANGSASSYHNGYVVTMPTPGTEAHSSGEGDPCPIANLDALLVSLSGQLNAAAYVQVQELVRDVKARRVMMSRDEFIQAFTAIVQLQEQAQQRRM
jgi:hypothetical protein